MKAPIGTRLVATAILVGLTSIALPREGISQSPSSPSPLPPTSETPSSAQTGQERPTFNQWWILHLEGTLPSVFDPIPLALFERWGPQANQARRRWRTAHRISSRVERLLKRHEGVALWTTKNPWSLTENWGFMSPSRGGRLYVQTLIPACRDSKAFELIHSHPMSVYLNGVQVLTARGSSRGALTDRISCLDEPAELVIKFERWTGTPIWGLVERSSDARQRPSMPPATSAPLYRGQLDMISSFLKDERHAQPLDDLIAFAIERPPPKEQTRPTITDEHWRIYPTDFGPLIEAQWVMWVPRSLLSAPIDPHLEFNTREMMVSGQWSGCKAGSGRETWRDSLSETSLGAWYLARWRCLSTSVTWAEIWRPHRRAWRPERWSLELIEREPDRDSSWSGLSRSLYRENRGLYSSGTMKSDLGGRWSWRGVRTSARPHGRLWWNRSPLTRLRSSQDPAIAWSAFRSRAESVTPYRLGLKSLRPSPLKNEHTSPSPSPSPSASLASPTLSVLLAQGTLTPKELSAWWRWARMSSNAPPPYWREWIVDPSSSSSAHPLSTPSRSVKRAASAWSRALWNALSAQLTPLPRPAPAWLLDPHLRPSRSFHSIPQSPASPPLIPLQKSVNASSSVDPRGVPILWSPERYDARWTQALSSALPHRHLGLLSTPNATPTLLDHETPLPPRSQWVFLAPTDIEVNEPLKTEQAHDDLVNHRLNVIDQRSSVLTLWWRFEDPKDVYDTSSAHLTSSLKTPKKQEPITSPQLIWQVRWALPSAPPSQLWPLSPRPLNLTPHPMSLLQDVWILARRDCIEDQPPVQRSTDRRRETHWVSLRPCLTAPVDPTWAPQLSKGALAPCDLTCVKRRWSRLYKQRLSNDQDPLHPTALTQFEGGYSGRGARLPRSAFYFNLENIALSHLGSLSLPNRVQVRRVEHLPQGTRPPEPIIFRASFGFYRRVIYHTPSLRVETDLILTSEHIPASQAREWTRFTERVSEAERWEVKRD